MTLEPTGNVKSDTGITPQTEMNYLCKTNVMITQESFSEINTVSVNVKSSVSSAFKEKDEQNGAVNGERLMLLLGDKLDKITVLVDVKNQYFIQFVDNNNEDLIKALP